MQRPRFLLAASSLAFTGIALWVSGCGTVLEDCTKNDLCAPYNPDAGPGGSIGATCAGLPTDTDPATMALKAFNTKCAVFAWAGATGPTPDGTMQNPFPTLQAAIDAVTVEGKDQGKWVIACNKDDFQENATTPNSVQIFGGFDCSTLAKWTPDPAMKKTNLLGKDATQVALTLRNGGAGVSVLVQDFSITAPSATAKGGSSIAVAVDYIAASFVRCDIKAGDGMDGIDGQPPMGSVMNGANAMLNATTMDACLKTPASLSGGAPGMTTCDDGVTSGGAGGKGGITANGASGQSGADGQPSDVTQGKGGAGSTVGSKCDDGLNGKAGASGGPGEPGPASTSLDQLTLTGSGGGNGGDGGDGKHGQGGGGGGGEYSGTFCAGNIDGNGPSGGGGGAGGCRGKGGGGGQAGGSSIAIVSLATGLTLTDVSLVTGKGGKGGKGAPGQSGGAPGSGSVGGTSPSKQGCKGGDGGPGGSGGPGGGGRGGHALGIAYASSPDAAPLLKTYAPGTPGSGGDAGPGGPMTSNGANGHPGACWDFLKNAACK